MKTVAIVVLSLMVGVIAAPATTGELSTPMEFLLATLTDTPRGNQSQPAEGGEVAVVCFLKSEQVSGMNKICYYDCMGSGAAITIGAAQLCPLSINQ